MRHLFGKSLSNSCARFLQSPSQVKHFAGDAERQVLLVRDSYRDKPPHLGGDPRIKVVLHRQLRDETDLVRAPKGDTHARCTERFPADTTVF